MTQLSGVERGVRARPDPLPLRIALYSGVIFERDAVSQSLLRKLDLLQRLGREGAPIEVVAFTQGSDIDRPGVRVVNDLFSLVRQPEFAAADLHVFEFAMCYELFNALFLIDSPSIVVDHNTTPPHLVDSDEVRAACEQAVIERHNLERAAWIVTDSEFTRNELLSMGMSAERASVLHLPPVNIADRRRHTVVGPAPEGGPVRMLYVGRLVPAKGILDLLEAATQMWDSGQSDLQLTIAGSLRFCDEPLVVAIRRIVERYGADGRLKFVTDPTDEEVAALYGRSHVFVMPSHHEGYCIPVVEAMASGSYVIGSDAGNIPYIMGGLGTSYPVGDRIALRGVIEAFLASVGTTSSGDDVVVLPTDRGPTNLEDWRQAVADYLKDYTAERFDERFLDLLCDVVAERGGRSADLAQEIRDRRPREQSDTPTGTAAQ